MADTGIFATTAEVQRKIGLDANATANTEAYINQFISEAESYINAICGYNFSDVYADLNVDVKALLKMAASNLAAIFVLNYSLSGFQSMREAETRIDVLTYFFNKSIAELKTKDVINFIKDA